MYLTEMPFSMIGPLMELPRSRRVSLILVGYLMLLSTFVPDIIIGQEIQAVLEAQQCFEETQKKGRPISNCQPQTIVMKAVECFEESLKRGQRGSDCELGTIRIETLMSPMNKFPRELYEDARSSLKQLALTSDNLRVRISAVSLLARQGHQLNPEAVPGTVNELAALYHQSDQRDVKYSIISRMRFQAEREAAINFLAEVAAEPDILGVHWPPPFQAAIYLSKMGPEGAAALQRLHASGKADQRVQRFLDRIAKNNYRYSP